MAQDIRALLSYLVTLQAATSITSPVAQRARKAYQYSPPRQAVLEAPCFLNTWTLTRVRREPLVREQYYTIRTQFAVLDADLDRAADIATAFHLAYFDKVEAEAASAFGGRCERWHHGQGTDPTLVLLDWAGQTYVGFDETIEIQIRNTVTYT